MSKPKIGTKVRVTKEGVEHAFTKGTEGVVVGKDHPQLWAVRDFLPNRAILVEAESRTSGVTTVQLMREDNIEVIEDNNEINYEDKL